MSAPLRIWLEVSHYAPFRVAGWAWVRRDHEVAGTAGGERDMADAERAALSALLSCLKTAGNGPVEIASASALVAGAAVRVAAAKAGTEVPTDNLDLWAQLSARLDKGGVSLRRVEASTGSPSEFAAAWADFARDRARDRGGFSAAIPRPNLARLTF